MGQLLTTASTLACPHGGSVSAVSSNTRAKAGGDAVVRASDSFTIAGCAFALPSGTPHPCVTVQWTVTALRNTVLGDPVLTSDSVGLCQAADQVPQGTVLINATQTKASGL
jgi:hypothetical protein